MEAFGCRAGSRSLRRVPLRLSQLGHSDGKLGELRDKHQHCGLFSPSPNVAANASSRAVARSLFPVGVG